MKRNTFYKRALTLYKRLAKYDQPANRKDGFKAWNYDKADRELNDLCTEFFSTNKFTADDHCIFNSESVNDAIDILEAMIYYGDSGENILNMFIAQES